MCFVKFIQYQPCITSAFHVENPLRIVHLTTVFSLKASCHLLHLSFPEEANNYVNCCSIVVTSYITTYSDVGGQTVLNVSQWGGGEYLWKSKQRSACLVNRKSLTLPVCHTQEILIFTVLLVWFQRVQSEKHSIYFLLMWLFSLCWPVGCSVNAIPGMEAGQLV